MEKFEAQYEAQKIPEFYNSYFNYQAVKQQIKQAKKK